MGSDQEKRSFEFAVLMQRAKKSGLKPADVARLLRVSDARMSQLVGGAAPTARMLGELREKINAIENPSLPQPASSPDELHAQLSDLEKHDPAGYEAARVTIGALHSKLPKPVRPSKKPIEQPTGEHFDRQHPEESNYSQAEKDSDDKHEAEADRILMEGIERAKSHK